MGNDDAGGRHANLSAAAKRYLDRLGASVEDLFHHVLSVLHDPAYREANAGALRMEWPRIPLPGWPDGGADGAAAALAESAARGRELTALLDPETRVPGVTQTPLRPETAAIAVPATVSGRNLAGDDFAVTAGWGHYGQGDAVMPGQGRAIERSFSAVECATLSDASSVLGERTFEIYLNDRAFWRNVPEAVWSYRLGGYQVLKKWLWYRERLILGRPIKLEEVQHFSDMARRIRGIIMSMPQGLSASEGISLKDITEDSPQHGIFSVPPDQQANGSLTLAGRESQLQLWSDSPLDISTDATITGILDDLTKVSLIGCNVKSEGHVGKRASDTLQISCLTPQCILLGSRYISD